MKTVFYLVLVLGVALAGGAVYMANNYIMTYQAELDRVKRQSVGTLPTVDVVVTDKALRYGQFVKPDALRLVAFPEEAVPEGAFTSLEDVMSEGDSVFRTVIRAMEKDEVLLAVKVTDPGEDAGVSARLGKGMRAFAINVDVTTGVSGFLRPGDRVDVYWTGRLPGQRNGGSVTKLIQSGMHLIAIDQQADKDANDPAIARTVTVEATPEQVAGLATAQSTGKLSLALVGSEDESEMTSIEIDQSTLLGIEEEVAEVVEEEKVCTIRTRRGGEIVETPIPCTD
jgi:pilus assembly protein CpaB